jgi:hypothetical protein
MTVAKLRTAQPAIADRNTKVGDLCREQLKADGEKLIKRNRKNGARSDD